MGHRTEEAVATGADQIAVGCPFCTIMRSAGLALQQSEGKAREEVEVLDVAQTLLASIGRSNGGVGVDNSYCRTDRPTRNRLSRPTSFSGTAFSDVGIVTF